MKIELAQFDTKKITFWIAKCTAVIALYIFLLVGGEKYLLGKVLATNAPGWMLLLLLCRGVFFKFALFVAATWFLVRDLFAIEVQTETAAAIIKKVKRWAIGMIAVILFIGGFFAPDARYRHVSIDGKTPSKYKYVFALAADAISGKTKEITIAARSIFADNWNYKQDGRTAKYLYYHVETDKGTKSYAVYLDSEELFSYLRGVKEYGSKDTYDIVFYPHSGVVKSIDGLLVSDAYCLGGRTTAMRLAAEAQKAAEQQKADEDAAAAEEEKSRRWGFTYYTMMESVGKKFDDILASFEAENVPFEMEVFYVHTQSFNPGEVVFYDNPKRAVYVALDREWEDMIPVPDLYAGMPLPDIERALQQAGIQYECDISIWSEDKEDAELRLNTYYCGPGTLVPKDNYLYWFSVK